MTSRFSDLLPLTLGVAATLFAAGNARQAKADLTVVTETTLQTDVAGANPPDFGKLGDEAKPFTISIAYQKGKLSRYDTPNRIILRGLQYGTISVLDPVTRTFYVTTESDEYARINATASASEKLDGIRIIPKTRIATIRGTRSILGIATHGLTYSIDLALQFPKGMPDAPDSFKVTASGEMWATTSLSVIPGEVSPRHALSPMPAELATALDKISARLQGTPLKSTLVFHLAAGTNGQAVKLQMTQHEDIRSISHAPLPDDLFRVPDGYTLVQVPAKSTTPTDARPAAAAASRRAITTGA